MDFRDIIILMVVFFQAGLGSFLIGRFLVNTWHSLGSKTGGGRQRAEYDITHRHAHGPGTGSGVSGGRCVRV